MAIKRNKVKLNLGSYPPVLIMGERKVGKSTLCYNLAELVYSLDEMLLISLGKEKGYQHLDDVQFEEARVWTKKEDENGERGFIQIVEDIVKNNNELGLKMVVIDTLDELYAIGTEEVLRQHRIEKQTPCKSLNDAFGGFNRGKDRLVSIVSDAIDKLDRMGIAVFILAHTKWKEKTDVLTGDKYEVLTNNLRADLYGDVANTCQMIVNITIDRVIEDGKQVGENRYLNFRSNGLVDCGSRFNELPEKLELSAENFMKAFETGVKSSMKKKLSDEEIKIAKKTEEREIQQLVEKIKEEVLSEDIEENTVNKDELLSQIQNKMKSVDADARNKAIAFVKAKGGKTSEMEIEDLKELLNILN